MAARQTTQNKFYHAKFLGTEYLKSRKINDQTLGTQRTNYFHHFSFWGWIDKTLEIKLQKRAEKTFFSSAAGTETL